MPSKNLSGNDIGVCAGLAKRGKKREAAICYNKAGMGSMGRKATRALSIGVGAAAGAAIAQGLAYRGLRGGYAGAIKGMASMKPLRMATSAIRLNRLENTVAGVTAIGAITGGFMAGRAMRNAQRRKIDRSK